MTAKEFMMQYLGGNLNISSLTPEVIEEMMEAFAAKKINEIIFN